MFFIFAKNIRMDMDCEALFRNSWKSPARVTPEAQVPLTPESNLRMTPVKS